MQSYRTVAGCLIVLALAMPMQTRAQDAVVLSGGGSRGLAHVGVLERLQELGYDADIVVGNSMGAVIGALYAAGYTADEILRRVEAVDWGAMFTALPVVSGPDQSIRLPMLSFDLTIGNGWLHRGLFGEWRINRTLVAMLFDANVRARGDFDRLPRRFRALAADLETGEAVVMGRGDLARAVRASMAYPGFFAPVERDGRLLIDGGIVDNLPTLEARQLGATRILAVDVTRPAHPIASHSPLAVVQRALNLMQMNLHRDTIPPDALVQPDIDSNFSGAAFPGDPASYMKAGYVAAVRDLDGLAGSGHAKDRVPPAPPATIDELVVAAPDRAIGNIVTRAFERLVPGPYDTDAILETIDRLYGSGLFQGIWPTVQHDDSTQKSVLHLRIDASSPSVLSATPGYDNDRGGRLWASYVAYTPYGRRPGMRTIAASFTPIDRWAAVSTRVFSLSHTGLALASGAHIRERAVRTFSEDVLESIEVWRAGAWVGFERPLDLRHGFVTAAVRAERIDPENSESDIALGPFIRVAQVEPEVSIVGEPYLLEGELRTGTITYSRLAARGSLTFDVAPLRFAVVADVRATSENTPIDDLPTLGDEHAIPGLRWGEFRGRYRAVAGIDIAQPLFSGHARVRVRTGSVMDELSLDESQWVTGVEAGLIWPIPLGVVQAGWGIATRGDGRFVVDIGRNF